MSSSDVLLIILVIAVIAFVVYRKRKKHLPLFPGASNTSSAFTSNVALDNDYILANNHMAFKQSQNIQSLHGVSIYALCPFNGTYENGNCGTGIYDNVSDLDTNLNNELVDLIKDGFKPSINSIVNNNVVIFYITY